MRAPEIRGPHKGTLVHVFYLLQFNVTDQLTHPQPESGKELSWSEAGRRRGLTSHPDVDMAGRAL